MEAFTLTGKPRSGPDVFRLWFTPSGRRMLILTGHGGGANRLWSWDVAGGRATGRREVVNDSEHDNGFPFPKFDRTRRYMLFDDFVEDRKTRRRIELKYMFSERAIGPDGREVFALGEGKRINRFDLSWGFEGDSTTLYPEKARALVRPGEEYSEALTVSPAGDLLAVWTTDGRKLYPFRLPDGQALPAVELPVYETDGVRMMMEPYGRLRFAPDGRTLAVAGDGVVLADLLDGSPARTLDERHFADLAFTPDGSRLIGVRPDGAAVEWEVASGAAARSFDFKAEAGRLRAVAVAPDGQTAVAGGSLGRLVRWDL